MYAVIFEVCPHPGHYEAYLDIAATLRPELEQIDGFISIERFSSLTEEGKILSLSFFRDEASIQTWREQLDHRRAQQLGRHQLFKDYRLRIAAVIRDYGLVERDQAPSYDLGAKATTTNMPHSSIKDEKTQ